jgi:hypothetical protein
MPRSSLWLQADDKRKWWLGVGGDRGTRTPGLRIANAALSQLSYIPTEPRHHRSGVPLNYRAEVKRRSRL